jgi:hypothetical protein
MIAIYTETTHIVTLPALDSLSTASALSLPSGVIFLMYAALSMWPMSHWMTGHGEAACTTQTAGSAGLTS